MKTAVDVYCVKCRQEVSGRFYYTQDGIVCPDCYDDIALANSGLEQYAKGLEAEDMEGKMKTHCPNCQTKLELIYHCCGCEQGYPAEADHLAALEAAVQEWKTAWETENGAVKKLEAMVREKDRFLASKEEALDYNEATITKQVEQIAALEESRDFWKREYNLINAAELKAEEEIATLKEELRLSGLRGDSLDRVISESTDEYVALHAENKRLLKEISSLKQTITVLSDALKHDEER